LRRRAGKAETHGATTCARLVDAELARYAASSRRKFFASVAGTDTLILPIHFPTPTVGLITADGDRFDYRFKRD
jgi:hypothetical protein